MSTAAVMLAVALVLLWLAVRLAQRHRPAPQPLSRSRAPKRRVRRDVPTALYCYLHAVVPGRVYVGISNDPESRHRWHEVNSPWFRFSTGEMRIVAVYPNRRAAMAAETAAIRRAALAGEPLANDVGNPLRRKGVIRRAA